MKKKAMFYGVIALVAIVAVGLYNAAKKKVTALPSIN